MANWDGKEGRCAMYCAGLPADDWLSICDCFEAERCVPKGSIGNPLTESDLPFTVAEEGCYWIRLGSMDAQQLPFSPAGSTLDVEVRRGE